MFSKPLDILAIGDTTVDAFIELKDARTSCSIKDDSCELCLRFADKVPYESVDVIAGVGNAANAAVSNAKLGLRSGFLGVVGDDRNGEECIQAMKSQGVDTRYVTKERGNITNYHYVLSFEAERTILIKHQEYKYSIPKNLKVPKWLYLSSIGENSLSYHHEIAAYVAANPGIKLAFQPGTFQMKMGSAALKDIYARTEIFFCNKEEAQRILGSTSTDIGELLESVRALGPKIVVITDGRKGLSASDGTVRYSLPIYPDRKSPVERTGAGDACASTIVASLALGNDLKTALTWGPINSMAVVEQVGAQRGLLKRAELESLLKVAPSDYRITTF